MNFFGYKINYPLLDFSLISAENENIFTLHHKYMKYFLMLSVFLGMRFLSSKIRKAITYLVTLIKLKILKRKPIKHKNRWVVIFGFGDNINSVTLAKYFANRGYNLLLLVDYNVAKVRKQYNLNQIQEIDKLTHINILEYDYDAFVQAQDFSLQEGVIEYVFDTSVLRLYNDDLSQKDKDQHLSSIFYTDAVSGWFNKYSMIMDKLRLYFLIRNSLSPMRIYLFNYPDKAEEVNHKIFYDLRKSLYENYQEVYKDSVFFSIIRFYNEYKGYDISENQLKTLEIVKLSNKRESLYTTSESSEKENICELNFI